MNELENPVLHNVLKIVLKIVLGFLLNIYAAALGIMFQQKQNVVDKNLYLNNKIIICSTGYLLHSGLLLSLFFYPEDGDKYSLRNVG
jgi:hypothetical protein